MEQKQWVQHISGQGEKWEVEEEYGETQWKVIRTIPKARKTIGMSYHYLPKSEYCLCEPPEVWRDCTETIKLGCEPSCLLYDELGRNLSLGNGYRLRKVQLLGLDKSRPASKLYWAFIVEQKVSQ